MYCIIFKSKLKNNNDNEYAKMAEKILSLAKTQEGFISFESYHSNNSDDRLAIIHFDTEENILNWKNNPKHLHAQKLGKEKWYESYQVEVCKVIRQYE